MIDITSVKENYYVTDFDGAEKGNDASVRRAR